LHHFSSAQPDQIRLSHICATAEAGRARPVVDLPEQSEVACREVAYLAGDPQTIFVQCQALGGAVASPSLAQGFQIARVGLDRKASIRFSAAQHINAAHNSHEQLGPPFPPFACIQRKEQNHAGEKGNGVAR
jgi:hypothetical protein